MHCYCILLFHTDSSCCTKFGIFYAVVYILIEYFQMWQILNLIHVNDEHQIILILLPKTSGLFMAASTYCYYLLIVF